MKTKLIDLAISKDDQDVNYCHLFEMAGHKVRIRIRSNAYASQCSARAEIWSPSLLKWNEIAHRTHGAMQTPFGLCYQPNNGWKNSEAFRADADYLMRMAGSILESGK